MITASHSTLLSTSTGDEYWFDQKEVVHVWTLHANLICCVSTLRLLQRLLSLWSPSPLFPDMLESINSLPDDHNGHLRTLIGQRNARADVHSRLSAAVSDFSDSPSVYSHSYFSPRPPELGDSRVGYAYSSSISNVGTERYEPHTSILDLTDDRRSSYGSQDYDNTDSESEEEMPDESETIARMSYLGPKMRVHSRAPWEEEAIEEVDEENSPRGSSFSRKHAAKSIASAFSSPRPSFAGSVGRQSEDSSTSQLATRPSFETINSQVSLSHTRGGL
jgi:hypothetical protein